MKKVAAFLCVFFSLAVVGYSQTAQKTITNFDLEKYSSRRIAADREYRRTYAEKGMPSPDEIRAQSDTRIKETLELADKMRAAEIEREKLAVAALQAQAQLQPTIINQGSPSYYPDNGYWGYGYGGGIIDGFGNRFGRNGRFINNRGYYAAGGVVWPAPITTGGSGFPRPSFSRPVARPHR